MEKDTLNTISDLSLSGYKITVESENEKGRKIISDIIKRLLEDNFTFRSLFGGCPVIMDDREIDDDDLREEFNKLINKDEQPNE